MAKRVYELAKELNIAGQDLLKRLRSLGVPAESLMELVEDSSAEQIRAELSGADKTAAVEETRVKPTVIRRRRKNDAEDEEAEQAEPVAETASEEEASPAVAGAEPAATAEPVMADAPAEPETKPAPKTKKGKAVPAAKIISRPAVKPETEPEPEPVAVVPEVPEVEVEDAVAAEAGTTPEAVDTETVTEPEAKKPAKKKSKDTPARVISLPKKTVEVKAPAAKIIAAAKPQQPKEDAPVRGKNRFGNAAPVSPTEVAAPPKEDLGRRNKKKTKDAPVAEDDSSARKKGAPIRKRSVEGDALYDDDRRGGKGFKGGKGKKKQPPVEQKTLITTAKAIKRRIKVDDTIVLGELAKRMGVKATDIIKTLMGMGVMATVNQTIDYDTAVLVAAEFSYEVERAAFEEETLIRHETTADDPEKLKDRPPVVTIMGHVDHGKTSLLDTIRRTKVTDTEHGGITQHIGAYYVTTKRGIITFLDTPGHEAFTAMRARGAGVTDIVVLVVAADDGVMPQTIEAINHARAANVPIIVAVNKIDKPAADVGKVTRELSDHGVTPEDWGGENIFVEVSAKQNLGIDTLLEMILLQAEVLELRANPDKPALGHVVEAQLDSGRGAVATILVREGTLRTGDPVVCGIHSGKIRAMYDDQGVLVTEAGPSIPVEIIGLSGVPEAGDELNVAENDKAARQISLHRQQKQRSKELAQSTRLSLDKLYERMQLDKSLKTLNLIIKADVQGSAEAITDSMLKLSNEEVEIKVIHAAPGTISESDITLAAVSDAIIIGFNVRPSQKVQIMANEEGIDMRFYNIIYDAIKDVKNAMLGLMESTFVEKILGHADVRQVFHVPKIGAIAGSYVTDGKLERGRMMRLLRDGVVIYEGRNSSLRRFKDDVKEVATSYECGIGIENFNDIKEGDTIECYIIEEVRPELVD